ncbi:MAG TPA: aminotransferase class I/II-fold pyridoxal phosphate-dependent enzyme [Candidatus Saccharimonadales bacterium]|nr:aminotransferase class I/II-fold pyridoxal phosphate-dependent enzyme [Candidatus Saccharimonadales bacterium]
MHGEILEQQNSGEKIIDLTIGISNRPIPSSGKKAAISAITNNNTPYTAISGDSKLKIAIQKKLKEENKISSTPENIIISTGAKQIIFQTLFALTNPGDKVALIRPYWPAFTQMLQILKLKPFIIDLQNIKTIKDLKTDTKVKILLFDLPHNPSGKVFTKKELSDILIFAKKNNLMIISDESYEKLVYTGKQISLATIDKSMNDFIITIFSVSQSFSMMGWRIGYAVAPKEIISALEAIQSSITAATPYVSQAALTAILTSHEDYTQQLLNDFKKRRDIIYPKLKEIEWIDVALPESGPYFWCNIKKLTNNSFDFTQKFLKQQKIAVMPGEPFGTPGWIRIAFNVHQADVLVDVVAKLATFGETYEKNNKK